MDSTAIQQALVQQVSQYISQYTPNPRIISYLPNEKGDVMGRFESQGRVFSFRLSGKGLVYKPVLPRKDGESDSSYALRFDTGSEILLEQLNFKHRTDAAKAYKPRPSITIGGSAKKQSGDRKNPNCSAISYRCGVCISLGKNCIKNANTAALKDRLNKINSLARMAAKGQAVPQVKTGVIGSRTDPKSLMKKAQAQARELAKGGKTSTNPKVKPAYTLTKAEYEKKIEKEDPFAFKNTTVIDFGRLPRGQGKRVGGMVMGAMGSGLLQGKKEYQNIVGKLPDEERKEIAILERHAQIAYAKARSSGFDHNTAAIAAYAVDEGSDPHREIVGAALRGGEKVPPEVLKDYPDLAKQYGKQPDTKARQAAQRAAAAPNKTTTLATPYPLTAQAQKRLERGESITDFDTYAISKKGDKFLVTDPQKFEDKGKLLDKAGLADYMKALEAQPRAIKKSSAQNPVIPMSKDPDEMLRALRNGRLIGDKKQGYEIQEHPTQKGDYLITTMPNKGGDYSGVLTKKELVDFIKTGGDGARFNKATDKPQYSPDVQEFITAGERRVKKLSQDLAFFKKEGKPRKVKETQQLLDIQIRDLAALKKRTLDVDQKREEESNSRQSQKDAEIKSLVSAKPSVEPESIKARYANKAEEVGVLKAFDGLPENSPLHGESLYKRIKKNFSDKAKELGLGSITDGYVNFQQPLESLESKGWIAKVPSLGWNVSDGAIQTGLPMGGFSNGSTIKRAEIAPRKNEDPQGFSYVLTDAGKKALALTKNVTEPKQSDYIPLTSDKNLSNYRKNQQRPTDKIAVDRAKNDVANATRRINKIDDNIKKLKAGSGVMSDADIKKLATLERSKAEWEATRAKNQEKVSQLTKAGDAPQSREQLSEVEKNRLIQRAKDAPRQYEKIMQDHLDPDGVPLFGSDGVSILTKSAPPAAYDSQAVGISGRNGLAPTFLSQKTRDLDSKFSSLYNRAAQAQGRKTPVFTDEMKKLEKESQESFLKDYAVAKESGIVAARKRSEDKPKENLQPRLAQTDLFGNPVAIPEPDVAVVAKPKPKAKAKSSKVDVFTPEMKSYAEKVLKDAEKRVEDLGISSDVYNAFINERMYDIPTKYKKEIPSEITPEGKKWIKDNADKYSQQEVDEAVAAIEKARSLEQQARQTGKRDEKERLRREARSLSEQYGEVINHAEAVNYLTGFKRSSEAKYRNVYGNYRQIPNNAISRARTEFSEEGKALLDKIKSQKVDEPITIDLTKFGGGKYEVKPTPEAIKTFREVLAKAKTQTDANFKSSGGGLSKASEKDYKEALASGDIDQATYELLTGKKRTDSADLYHVRIPNSILVKTTRKDSFNDSDRILTYITDNSGNMMGIVQLGGIKYRFLKPIIGATVLTPISETSLGYLFDMAPDLSLVGCGDPLDKLVTL